MKKTLNLKNIKWIKVEWKKCRMEKTLNGKNVEWKKH
jgi:hypothetical protein